MSKKIINEFLNGKIQINCKTPESADALLKYCCKLGLIRWGDGDLLTEENYWYRYGINTIYIVDGTPMADKGVYYGSRAIHADDDMPIIEFSKLETNKYMRVN